MFSALRELVYYIGEGKRFNSKNGEVFNVW